jgi:4-amino-4-deoxy-L-arabinose transferase-like glycosyltransferase
VGAIAAIGQPHRSLSWAIFALALLVRVVAIDGTIGWHTAAAAEPAADSRIHIALVQSLLRGHGYSLGGLPTAITPPLYIFFLAAIYRVFADPLAVRLAQAILGAVGCVVLYSIGRRLFDDVTGLIAAAILSVYPFVVYLTGLHLTENLFLFLLLLIVLQSQRVMERPTLGRVVGLGGLIGLAALTRAVFLAFLPFLLVWAVGLWGVRTPLAYRVFGVAAMSAVMIIIPWTVRNYVILRALVPVQSNAGMVLWAGNNPHADGGLVWPTRKTWTGSQPPDDGMYGWRGLSLAADNQRYVRAVASWIGQHPLDYLRLLGRKLVRLYEFTRGEDRHDLPVPRILLLFQVLFLASAAGGILLTLSRWRTSSMLLALVLFTNMMALVFSGGTRYTIPMVPSLILFSAVALVAAGRYGAWAVKSERVAVGG